VCLGTVPEYHSLKAHHVHNGLDDFSIAGKEKKKIMVGSRQ
jgi:hypothetical protein